MTENPNETTSGTSTSATNQTSGATNQTSSGASGTDTMTDEQPTNPDPNAGPARGPAAPRRHWLDTPIDRDRDRGKAGGVLAGLSEAYDLDLRTTRIAVVLASLVLPAVGLGYLLAWLLLPKRPEPPLTLRQLVRDRRRVPILIALAIVVVAGGFGMWSSPVGERSGGFVWGAVLVVAGVLLWRAADRRTGSVPPPPPYWAGGTPLPPPVGTPLDPDSTLHQTWASSNPPPPPFPGVSAPLARSSSTPVLARRRRVPTGIMTTGLLGLALGGVALGDAFSWWHFTGLLALTAIVVALAVGSLLEIVLNRNGWSTFGFLSAGALATVLIVGQPHLFDGGMGKVTRTPTTAADAQASKYELGVGNLVLDLRQVPLAATPVKVRGEIGVGKIDVIVPADVTVKVREHFGIGGSDMDGRQTGGIRTTDDHTYEVQNPVGTIELDLRAGIGGIELQRSGQALRPR